MQNAISVRAGSTHAQDSERRSRPDPDPIASCRRSRIRARSRDVISADSFRVCGFRKWANSDLVPFIIMADEGGRKQKERRQGQVSRSLPGTVRNEEKHYADVR